MYNRKMAKNLSGADARQMIVSLTKVLPVLFLLLQEKYQKKQAQGVLKVALPRAPAVPL